MKNDLHDQDYLFDHLGAAARGDGIFGLSCAPEESKLILLPVPWEATVSYGNGTSGGPQAILAASTQVDLYDRELGLFYKAGIAMLPESKDVRKWNKEAKIEAQKIMKKGGVDASNRKAAKRTAELGEKVNDFVYRETKKILSEDKIPGLLGGDHSTPLGSIKACAENYGGIGILHIDAHCDLRESFEDFAFSHGSIMRNVLERILGVKKLVQVGIRDFCREEKEYMTEHATRIDVFFDEDMAADVFSGIPWKKVCENIVSKLPENVYISLDVDGLDPSLCPHSGTPVPGGLTFNQMQFLLKVLVKSGRKIVGFDLVEVVPGREGEWDANVGASLLFILCGWALYSQGDAKSSKK